MKGTSYLSVVFARAEQVGFVANFESIGGDILGRSGTHKTTPGTEHEGFVSDVGLKQQRSKRALLCDYTVFEFVRQTKSCLLYTSDAADE